MSIIGPVAAMVVVAVVVVAAATVALLPSLETSTGLWLFVASAFIVAPLFVVPFVSLPTALV